MTDTPAPATPQGAPALPVLALLATLGAWGYAIVRALQEYANYSDRRDSFSISAPQISQIADEFMVAVSPGVIIALAVTSISVMLLLMARRT